MTSLTALARPLIEALATWVHVNPKSSLTHTWPNERNKDEQEE
jgi:hypothetical protein